MMESLREDADPSIDPAVIAGLEELQEPGAPDFLADLIRSYLEEVPARLSVIEAGIRSGDHVQLARACHVLKGSSANLGAQRLADCCKDLEIKAALAQADLFPAARDRLHAEFKSAERELRALLASRPEAA